MLLHRLVEYTNQHGTTPPFHRSRQFQWCLNIPTGDGSPTLFSLVEPNANGKPRGRDRMTPAVTRANGVAANMGADDIQYVLGWSNTHPTPTRVRECHDAFVSLLHQWIDNYANGDLAARAVWDFYSQGGVDLLEPPETYDEKDGVLITVDDTPIIDHTSLIHTWTQEAIRRKQAKQPGLCLVCGTHGPLVNTVPGNISAKLVPGAANNAALVSVNELTFGYQLTKTLTHTPLCPTCCDQFMAALTELLSSEHTVRFPDQDSTITWWSTGDVDDDFRSALSTSPDSDAVNRLLNRLWSGKLDQAEKQVGTFTSDRFCSVTLGGNASRIVIREWVDQPLPTVVANLARWYNDLRTVVPWHDEPVTSGLWKLALATGEWDSDRSRYTKGRRPVHIHRDLLSSALHSNPLPPSVLHHVLHRITSDRHLDAPRVALLRLALRRHPTKEIAMTAGLDETCEDTAYVSGRVFACLEQIQYAANDGRPNVTFGDRFLSGAITNPTPALNAGEKLAPAWLSKLRRNESTAGTAYVLDRKLSDLRALLNRHRPASGYLPPDQQALFLLGYHHQKSHDAAQARTRKQTQHHETAPIDGAPTGDEPVALSAPQQVEE